MQNQRLHLALVYAERGWHVFPLQARAKLPATRHGFKDATTNPTQINAWWSEHPEYNIGIATGRVSGFWVVDVDNRYQGDNILLDLIHKNSPLPSTVETITGNGSHYYFTYPDLTSIPSCKLDTGIDIKSDGGYIVAPGSIHPNGQLYQFEGSSDPMDGVAIVDAPAWLLERVSRHSPPRSAVHCMMASRNQYVDPKRVAELQAALRYVPADDYELWIRIGLALFALDNDDTGFRLWDEWSQISKKYDAQVMGQKWRSFVQRRELNPETVFYEAQQRGWVNQSTVQPVSVETLRLASTSTANQQDIPDILFSPPGIVGDIATFINQSAFRPQPVFAINGALSLCAAVLARKVKCGRVRTNLYLCSLGGTGSGKEHARQVIKQIMTDTGRESQLGGENIASGQAILTRTAETPNVLYQIDEFGDFLHAAQNPNSGSHRAEIVTNLMRIHGNTNSIFKGTDYASSLRESKALEYPCLNLHATTTPETFYASLGSRDLANGFLNRMLICETPTPLPKKNRKAHLGRTPEDIIQWVYSIDTLTGQGNLQGLNPAEPFEVIPSPSSDQVMDEFEQWTEVQVKRYLGTGVDALWNRATEHAEKIALILAMGDNAVQIEQQHSEWAVTFVRYWTQYLANAVSQHVADSPTQALEQEIRRLISDTGAQGMTTRELTQYSRKFRAAPPTMREAALKWLTSNEEIQLAEIPTASGRGKKRLAYVALEVE